MNATSSSIQTRNEPAGEKAAGVAPHPAVPGVEHLRREMKFTFAHADRRKLEQVLEQNLTPIAYGDSDISRVSSIYFDDDMLSSCRESLGGINRRTKVRLRWYDRDLPAGAAFFELKHRVNERVRKDRTKVTLSEGAVNYAQLRRELEAVLPPRDACWLHMRPRPTVLVAYRRRHFSHPPTGARVTLDFDVTAYDQLGRQRVFRKFPIAIDALTVIEAKMPAGSEALVRQLLFPLRPRLSRSSKYVQCCARLGWCQLTDGID